MMKIKHLVVFYNYKDKISDLGIKCNKIYIYIYGFGSKIIFVKGVF